MQKVMMAACAAAMCAFAAPAGAQLMNLNASAPDWGLNERQVRVVQFALRDAGCFTGVIDGNVGPNTRQALQCAMERMNTQDLSALARGLNLYTVTAVANVDGTNTGGEPMASREMGGDVAAGGGMLLSQVDQVIMAAESGLTNVAPAQAAELLDGIATQLAATNMPALTAIAADLRSLRMQLLATPFNAMAVGQSLVTVAEKVDDVAQAASGEPQEKLMRLSNLLATAGRQLAP